jgi:hypothetical protein
VANVVIAVSRRPRGGGKLNLNEDRASDLLRNKIPPQCSIHTRYTITSRYKEFAFYIFWL